MSQDTNLDELIEKTDLEYMLEFETQIFLDVIHNDGLVVAAKGLNLDLIILNILKVYCDPGNLILVINATENEEKYFVDKLGNENVYVTTYDTGTAEREDNYLSGGVHFVTTRILVLDMLKKRIPVEKITGFVVLRAHKVLESCQEAFILRLYREHNKTGFIKAFSNSPESYTIGFGNVERVMRAIFVKQLYIWPRFHSLVNESFNKHRPHVIELHIPITEKMRKIQTVLLELMNLTVNELKQKNKSLVMQEITVENCLTKKFHKILQREMDIVWHQLSAKSQQLVADLKTLRYLMSTLFYSDSVSFYAQISTYRTKEYAQTASWVWYKPAELLFQYANSLIFTGDKEFKPEFSPKWESLLDIVKTEIPEDIKKSGKAETKILILCADNRTCFELREVLVRGPHRYLFEKALHKKINFKGVNKDFEKCDGPSTSKKLKVDEEPEEEVLQSSYFLTMSQSQSEDPIFEPFSEMENMNLTQICEAANFTQPAIFIQTFKGGDNYISLQKTLQDLKPNFVIVYQINVTAVRELEMYEAHRKKEDKLVVFFLQHNETVEEQSYLTALRREHNAFQYLIETKSKMVIPEDQDGKTDLCQGLLRDSSTPTKNTRQGGKEEAPKKQFVIVDMREFRSELPALIHKRGIDIEPVTITVGDYILTPEICIERKSLSDLIQSLNSGRLYQQCVQMTRYYTKPMLLIEFNHNKPFSWQNHYMLSSDAGSSLQVQQKLLLLTMHFPKLKIIWSPSPYASAQLFEELKQGKEEPNIEYAASIGGHEELDAIETKYNSNIYDFVQKLPGITSKNIDVFMRKIGNLTEAITKTEDELKEILGNKVDARSLYSIIHEEHLPDEEATKKVKPKGKFIKKKIPNLI